MPETTQPARTKMSNAAAVPWLRSLAFILIVVVAMRFMPFYPPAVGMGAALALAVLSVFSPVLAAVGLIALLSLPLLASDMLVGTLFVLISLGGLAYLGSRGARPLVVIALALVASLLKAEWALAAIVGYLIIPGDAAFLALVACLTIEVAGLATGAGVLGTVVTGAPASPLLNLASPPKDPLAFAWLSSSLAHVNPSAFLASLRATRHVPMLVLQPAVWALAAATTSAMRRKLVEPGNMLLAATAAVAGIGVAWAGSVALSIVFHGPIGIGSLTIGLVSALVVAVATIATIELVFPQVPIAATTLQEQAEIEEADVDELLRSISKAEAALANKHTATATVLITDMKSFSAMTEEDGSLASAKTVQVHRDLLLPIIAQHGGNGRDAGGDGLLAAFPSQAAAIAAAVRMQQALETYNASREGARPIEVRMGIATGSVVVDKQGRPFIGEALNHAARIMSLADGAQVFVAGPAGPDLTALFVSHGAFSLKNIPRPVEVLEVLWSDARAPKPPTAPEP